MIEVSSSNHGPLFDGRAEKAAREFAEDAEREIADTGANMVRTELAHVLKHPTGRYMSHIHTTRVSAHSVVTDGNIVYGPWLEGTGSRNRTTRFKGYFTFRKVTQRLQAKAVPIAEKLLRSKYLRRMN